MTNKKYSQRKLFFTTDKYVKNRQLKNANNAAFGSARNYGINQSATGKYECNVALYTA